MPSSNIFSKNEVLNSNNITFNTSVLIRRWSQSLNSKVFITYFAVVWNLIIFFASKKALTQDFSPAVLILFSVAGLTLAYFSICLWINKTNIQLEGQTLKVKHGPFPWFRNYFEIDSRLITQMYVQTYCSHHENNQDVLAYRVMAQMKTGSDICIDQGLSSYSDARILEQWLEKCLHLQNDALTGKSA